jgi:SMC interacting uncharacterized protein involved in chromosome segregation
LIKLEQQVNNFQQEISDLNRLNKEKDAKITELNRKFNSEKEQKTALQQVYNPKLKDTIDY